MYFASCTLLLLSLWQHLENSLHSLPVYDHPFESPVDRQGIFTDQPAIMFYSSWFSPLLIAMALNSLDDCVAPKKETLLLFLSSPNNERGWDINRVEEKQLFSPRGGWVLLPSTRSLLEGPFVWGWILRLIACIGVVVKLSRGDLSLWCQWWPCLRPVLLWNRSLVCALMDTSENSLWPSVRW